MTQTAYFVKSTCGNIRKTLLKARQGKPWEKT